MSTSQPNAAPEVDLESEIWSAIAAFEKILEAIPDDRSSLETLSHAYEHIGDQARTLAYLLRLGDVIVRDGDAEAAAYISEKLKGFGALDEEALGVCRRLDGLASSAQPPGAATGPVVTPSAAAPSAPGFRVADELAFAWRLFESGELTQEEYASVAQDLSDMSAEDHLSTISVLHTLTARAFSGLERLMVSVSLAAKTPIISLQSFDIPAEACRLLPVEFMIRRGVIIFGLIGNEALVAVMNPYDQTLREQVETQTRRPCHFFLALPAEFDAAIAKTGEPPPA